MGSVLTTVLSHTTQHPTHFKQFTLPLNHHEITFTVNKILNS